MNIENDTFWIKKGPRKERTHKMFKKLLVFEHRGPISLITSTFLSMEMSTVSVFGGVEMHTSHSFASPYR